MDCFFLWNSLCRCIALWMAWKNETDENGNVTVYVSNVDRSSGEPKLLGIDNESEWDRIKDVLRELSKPEAE